MFLMTAPLFGELRCSGQEVVDFGGVTQARKFVVHRNAQLLFQDVGGKMIFDGGKIRDDWLRMTDTHHDHKQLADLNDPRDFTDFESERLFFKFGSSPVSLNGGDLAKVCL